MKSLSTEIIPQRLGPVTADYPDASYKDEGAGILPTPVLADFMNSYHYHALRMLSEAGLPINDQVDNITNNQLWDAYLINTNKMILNHGGKSDITPLVISGKTRSLSSMPDFLRANGAALSFNILATAINLQLSISNEKIIVDADILTSSITAAPSTNNTADINDTSISGDLYAGEVDAIINQIAIDNVGSEISSMVGQVVAFKTPTGEIFRGLLKTASLITDIYRGFYFDDAGDPIVRGVLSDGDTITLMKIGWVFIENDGVTVDVSYVTPVVSYTAPPTPSVGDYWFDTTIQKWKRYSGTWDIINRLLLGEIVSDSTYTIATRPIDFTNNFKEENNIETEIFSTEVIKSKSENSRINVYGTEVKIDLGKISWDITSDLESPQSEAVSTEYFIYLTDKAETIISSTKPYCRADLKGYYHPYQSWRCISKIFNDSSANIFSIREQSKFNSLKGKDKQYYEIKSRGGEGSTATRIPYFNTLLRNEGIQLASITNDTTNGLQIAFLKKCKINMVFLFSFDNELAGISINATSTSTNIQSIGAPYVKSIDLSNIGGFGTGVISGLIVNASDIIRPHNGNTIGHANPTFWEVMLEVEEL